MLHAMDLTSSTSRTDQINADLDTIQAAPQVRALAGCGGPGRSDPVSRKFEIRGVFPEDVPRGDHGQEESPGGTGRTTLRIPPMCPPFR